MCQIVVWLEKYQKLIVREVGIVGWGGRGWGGSKKMKILVAGAGRGWLLNCFSLSFSISNQKQK